MTEAVNEVRGALVIQLAGDVDLEHSPRVRQLLLDQVATGKDLIVDLSAVEYIDSSGIAGLVEALQAANDGGSNFALAAVSPQAMRVIRLARLDTVFTIHGNLDVAVGAG